MQKLKDYFKSVNINEFDDLLKRRLIVTEKLQVPTIYVEFDGTEFVFLKNGKRKLDRVDRTIQLLYEIAVKHFYTMKDKVRARIPRNWRFGFDYVPETGITDYDYSIIPHNNLILTHIHEMKGDKINRTLIEPEILKKWAVILDVEAPNIIFDGNLKYEQKNELKELLALSDQDFKSKFDYDTNTYDKTSFTIKAFRIFDNNQTKSTLHNDLEKEIDGLVLTFINNNKAKTLKLEDFSRQEKEADRESSHIQQIAVTDFFEFLSQQDFSDVKFDEKEEDLRYIEMMSLFFNKYISENATKYIGVDFKKAEFADTKSFKLNTLFIKNQETLKLVTNQVLAELFKIVLGTFRKKKTKSTDLFDEELMLRLNEMVVKIKDYIGKYDANQLNTKEDKKEEETEDASEKPSESVTEEEQNDGLLTFVKFIHNQK